MIRGTVGMHRVVLVKEYNFNNIIGNYLEPENRGRVKPCETVQYIYNSIKICFSHRSSRRTWWKYVEMWATFSLPSYIGLVSAVWQRARCAVY